MSRNYSIFIVLWILVQLLVKVDCQTETFIPIQRILHTATFIDKLYILGGYNVTQSDDGGEIIGKQFFVNDTSVTFEFPQWKDLTNINIIPAHAGAASVKGVDNKTLILYGGRTFEKNENMNSVYMFDTLNNTWSTYEETYPHKRSLSALIDSNGKMYLFGGRENNGEIVNKMLILDTVNLSWSEGSSLNAPCARINYGAIILPNQ
ncbi:12702_t:CDS:1, partial [Funneliformis caledonium]